MFRITAVIILMMAAGCGASQEPSDNWLRACPSNQFCFSYPPQLKLQPQQAIDSVAGLYQGDVLQLDYDLGLYSPDFSTLLNPIIKTVIIDNRKGETLITDTIMAVRIPSVNGRIRFAMRLIFKGSVNLEVGHRIFESIRFLPLQQ